MTNIAHTVANFSVTPEPASFYPHYTEVAEKLEALTTLGIDNSRMKDYFDLWILSRYADFEDVIEALSILKQPVIDAINDNAALKAYW